MYFGVDDKKHIIDDVRNFMKVGENSQTLMTVLSCFIAQKQN